MPLGVETQTPRHRHTHKRRHTDTHTHTLTHKPKQFQEHADCKPHLPSLKNKDTNQRLDVARQLKIIELIHSQL